MRPVELRIEGHYITLTTRQGEPLPVAVCGLCSALVAREHDGELRHAVFHDATGTIEAAPAPGTTP